MPPTVVSSGVQHDVGFSLRFWKKDHAAVEHTPAMPKTRETGNTHKERADAYLQKMAETLLSIEERAKVASTSKPSVDDAPPTTDPSTRTETTTHTTSHSVPHQHAPSTHGGDAPSRDHPADSREARSIHPSTHFLIEDHSRDHEPRPDLAALATHPFHAHDGATYRTLGELGDALLRMDQATFEHHVTPERNDFVSWTEGCFEGNERAFAERLRSRDRQDLLRAFLELTSAPLRVERTEPLAMAVDERAAPAALVGSANDAAPVMDRRETLTATTPETPSHHDEKNVVLEPSRSPDGVRHDTIKHLQDELVAAHAQAKSDLAAARERFIAVRTRVFTELTEDERLRVLPALRHTYDYLRHAR